MDPVVVWDRIPAHQRLFYKLKETISTKFRASLVNSTLLDVLNFLL